MSDSKHTPGPWTASEGWDEIVGKSGRTVLEPGCTEMTDGPMHLEVESVDLNVILAAPDLLAELKAVQWGRWDEQGAVMGAEWICPSCLGGEEDGHSPDCTLAAAIAKAEGGAS